MKNRPLYFIKETNLISRSQSCVGACAKFGFISLLLMFQLGCGPTKQEKTRAIQCASALKVEWLRVYANAPSGTNEVEWSNSVSDFGICPVCGDTHVGNPDFKKWVQPESHTNTVAIYCPLPHRSTNGKKFYNAIHFDGTEIELSDLLFGTSAVHQIDRSD